MERMRHKKQFKKSFIFSDLIKRAAQVFFLIILVGCFFRICAQDTKPDKTLSFAFNGFQQKDTLKFAECTVRNNTDTLFWILGYDTTHTSGKVFIRPVFSMKEKKKGKWKDTELGFSGIGIERFSLSPGEEFRFETPDFDTTADAIKIGIEMRIRSREDKLRSIRVQWTDEIPLR